MEQLRVNRSQRSVPITLPAPVGGLNGKDGLANMPPLDAFVLDNIFPNSTTLDTKTGCKTFATGLANPVESIECYTGGNAQKLLAFAGGNIFDVSLGGAVGAALKSGRTSNKISSCMFSNAGSQFLIGVSGADAPFSYNGVAVTDLAITGLTGSQNTLHGVFAFKGRLYFAQKDQLGFYYLDVGAIQGPAHYFDLSQVARNGGFLVGIASFSNDSGNGPADYIVFMTSEAEYIVYAGTDPSSASAWSLVGRYYSSSPIGRKGWFNFRSDLYIICNEGIVAFSQIRSNGESGKDIEYISANLGRYITDLNQFSTNHGWCAEIYSKRNQLIVNVPVTSAESGQYVQFVMNTDTNAWCRFTDWNALTWSMFNRRLYFGTFDGRVMLADEGYLDDGKPIKCNCRQSYNYFDDGKGMGAADKQFHFATFIVQGEGTPPISAELNINFEDDQPDYAGNLEGAQGSLWDVSLWDLAMWGNEGQTQNFTVSFGKIGYTASIWLRMYLEGTWVRWYATRIIAEQCKGIVLL